LIPSKTLIALKNDHPIALCSVSPYALTQLSNEKRRRGKTRKEKSNFIEYKTKSVSTNNKIKILLASYLSRASHKWAIGKHNTINKEKGPNYEE